MTSLSSLGIKLPSILLPRSDIDLRKWAVIACDQYTSEPDYWQKVEEIVGDAPSTLRLVLPEVYLDTPEEPARVRSIQTAMRSYLDQGIFDTFDGMIYCERTVSGRTRRGLILCLDLECYDYNKGSQSLIRATEGTILDRLPPRMKIREGALLELPHILVLIDDPSGMVIEPLADQKHRMKKAYDFELMLASGHLKGYRVEDAALVDQVVAGLQNLANPQTFSSKYSLGIDQPVLLFAMGDGNHSLATAKAIWEKMKPLVGMDHPARYALVEIENVHDAGLEFEPIHRVLFNLKQDLSVALSAYYPGRVTSTPMSSDTEMVDRVNTPRPGVHTIGMVTPADCSLLEISNPTANLPVGTLQSFLDAFLKQGGAEKIDYVHGEDVVCRLGSCPDCAGFYLPGMDKGELFRTVILDGALPRKTFSMGEAHEKRFYLEARQIA